MFWMKKVATGFVLAALVTSGLFAGFAVRSDGVAQATVPLAADPQAPPEDPDAAARRVEKQLTELQKQKELLNAMMADLTVEKARLDNAKKARAAAAELGQDIAVSVGPGNPSGYNYTIREVVDGKVAEIHTSDIGMLRTYMTRAFNDSKGPKNLRIQASWNFPSDQLKDVFAVCAAAGYRKASLVQHPAPLVPGNTLSFTADNLVTGASPFMTYNTFPNPLNLNTSGGPTGNTTTLFGNIWIDPGTPTAQSYGFPSEIDLTKYAPKKP